MLQIDLYKLAVSSELSLFAACTLVHTTWHFTSCLQAADESQHSRGHEFNEKHLQRFRFDRLTIYKYVLERKMLEGNMSAPCECVFPINTIFHSS